MASVFERLICRLILGHPIARRRARMLPLPLPARQDSDSIAARCDCNEGLHQDRLLVGSEYVGKHLVHGTLPRGFRAEVQNPSAPAIEKYNTTKVAVASDEQPTQFLSCFEQFFVRGPRQTDVGSAQDIVSQAGQVTCCGCVYVLIEQKSQTGATRGCTSSAPTRAIA